MLIKWNDERDIEKNRTNIVEENRHKILHYIIEVESGGKNYIKIYSQ